ncbi:MAG TPA: hypothetical protein PLP65_05460 [Bacteroidales bacterium]|jgi:archaellum component FlaF (FlaF/FlaG flagellin family)|nr:hypothetical protein [Bacteroidales bacterium]HOU98275.1 hypothetical protein [Bacteroidales bacterium]
MKKTVLFWSLFFSFYVAFAQEDTIWFLSGERLISSQYNINVEDGILTYMNKHNKKKQVGLEYIFSVVDSKNKEKVYFESTTIGKTYFTVEQMRSFIQGEYLARNNYHAPLATASGIITGAGAVYAVPSLVGLNVFFSPLVPAANAAIIGSFNYKDEKVVKKYPEKKDDTYFIAGYKEVVTQKRINNSIKGGLIGLGLGVASAIIIHQAIK